MGADPSDVIIIGSGPAGATAAALLAQRQRRVTLIEQEAFPRHALCSGWLNAKAVPLLEEIGVPIKPLKKDGFGEVVFYNADFSKTAKPSFTDAPGYLIDRSAFDKTLVERANKGGATVLTGHRVTDIRLKESVVEVRLDDDTCLESRLAILASGRGTDLLNRVGLTHDRAHKPTWSAQVWTPATSSNSKDRPTVGLVLGLGDRGSFGLCCTSASLSSIALHWGGDRDEALPVLRELCHRAAHNNIVPEDLSDLAESAAFVATPAGAALDMDSHVGKHTLVIGDAGGFIASTSNEGIYPAMWSARIATEVIKESLQSPSSQDTLMTFDSRWRLQMADYLRSPHTDIQFLLPLIFSNQPMADRMGAAFFFGENI